MTLAAWYLFLGFPIFVIGLCALFFPKQFKKEIEPLFESTVNLKLISVWYYTVGAIIFYESFRNITDVAGKVMLVISLGLLAHSGVAQILSGIYSKFMLKNIKKTSLLIFRLLGSTLALFGLAMILYAIPLLTN